MVVKVIPKAARAMLMVRRVRRKKKKVKDEGVGEGVVKKLKEETEVNHS